MLVLHRSRRIVLYVLATVVLIVPISVFAINKFMMAKDTYAESYTMSEGFDDQAFYNCVVNGFKDGKENGDIPEEIPGEIPETGLTDVQLASITKLDCHYVYGGDKIGGGW